MTTAPTPPRLLRLLAPSRYLIVVAVLGTLLAATTLLGYGAWHAGALVHGLWTGAAGEARGAKALILAAIELTDLFLLATVLYVIAIGLFELFVDDRLELPPWLEIHSLDDLKDKLVGVIVVVLGVLFLGQVVTWDGERELLGYGVANAAMVAALTWFSSQKKKA